MLKASKLTDVTVKLLSKEGNVINKYCKVNIGNHKPLLAIDKACDTMTQRRHDQSGSVVQVYVSEASLFTIRNNDSEEAYNNLIALLKDY